MGRSSGFHTASVLLGACLVLGCASLGRHAPETVDLGKEIRPDAPAEYDVLVAQQHMSQGDIEAGIAAYERASQKDPDSAFLHRVLADAYARGGQLEFAVEHAEKAFALDPQDLLGRNLLAQLYRAREAPDQAIETLVGDDGTPLDVEAAGMLYQIQLEAGRKEEALATAQWWLENGDQPVQAHLAIANVYDQLGRHDDTEKALREAIALDPSNLRLYGALGRTLRHQGNQAGEIALYREILENHPDDQDTLLSLADAQMEEDDLEGALRTFETLDERFGLDLRSRIRLAFLYYEARQFGDAIPAFEQALKEVPEEHELAFFLGVCLRRENRPDEALEVFLSIPIDHKHYAESRTQVASIHERRGDYSAAQAAVGEALAIEPTRPLELYSATLRSKSGDLAGAISYLESLIDAEPENDELVYNLGVVFGESDQDDRAISTMRRALVLNPDNASALNYIGYTWADNGENLDEAEELISRAIELRPEDGYIVDSLGWLYHMRALPLLEQGRESEARVFIDRALQELERAEELTGGDPVISEHLGDTYLLLEQPRRAFEKFREAVELGPRDGEQPDLEEKFERLRRQYE